MLARLGETWVITRANNREAIESARHGLPEAERLHFVYVDLPSWARGWKKGQRGVRLYYLLWQLHALHVARALQRDFQFDRVWHLTLANAWLGSVAPFVGPPTILGPVGGGVPMAWRLLPALGFRGAVYEVTRAGARAAGRYANPLSRLACRRAAVILVQNHETQSWVAREHREKAVVFQNAVLDEDGPQERIRAESATRTAMFAGRLLAWKGGAIALRAISLAPDWRLIVCGTGPDEERLIRLADDLGLQDRVRFTGWLERAELRRLMAQEASVLLHPSIHDDSPFGVVEALAVGLPVICLDRGGPPLLAGDAGVAVTTSSGLGATARQIAQVLQSVRLPSPTSARKRSEAFLLPLRAAAVSRIVFDRPPTERRHEMPNKPEN
jgi:glycosyltransferase involved in cell wall biosynthesis